MDNFDPIREWNKLGHFDQIMLANAVEIWPEPLIAEVYFRKTSLWLAAQHGYMTSEGDCYWISKRGRAMVERAGILPLPYALSLLDEADA